MAAPPSSPRRARRAPSPLTAREARLRASGAVYFDRRFKCFRAGGRALKGAQALLERHLWPHYRLPRGADGPAERVNSVRGARRGLRVHAELQAYTRWVTRRGKMPAAFKRNRLHRLTRVFLHWLATNNARVLEAELPVGCPSLGVATAIDLVIECAGKVTALEIKTGMRRAWARPQGNVRGPMPLPNCPCTHAALQLGAGLFLMELCMPNARVDDGAVAHVSDDGVYLHRYSLPQLRAGGCSVVLYALRCERALARERDGGAGRAGQASPAAPAPPPPPPPRV